MGFHIGNTESHLFILPSNEFSPERANHLVIYIGREPAR